MRFLTTFPLVVLGIVVVVTSGCGSAKTVAPSQGRQANGPSKGSPADSGLIVLDDSSMPSAKRRGPGDLDFQGGSDGESDKDGQPALKKPDPGKAPIARKMVYTADVRLVVEDLDVTTSSIRELFKTHHAELAAEDAAGSKGAARRTTWKVRVPVAEFDKFLEAVTKLGELENSTTKSQDVTDEFYDLDARITQKLAEEKSLLKLQEEATAIMNKDPKARMEDVLAVRREWNNVRQEIERMQGRLKLLSNLSDLTTVTITINERKGYVPPTVPTFDTRISRTFNDSLGALVGFGKALVLFVTALIPWSPVILAVVGSCWFLLRRFRRRPIAEPAQQ